MVPAALWVIDVVDLIIFTSEGGSTCSWTKRDEFFTPEVNIGRSGLCFRRIVLNGTLN